MYLYFSKCSEKLKVEYFKSHCTSLYCSHVWSTYGKSIHLKKGYMANVLVVYLLKKDKENRGYKLLQCIYIQTLSHISAYIVYFIKFQ